MKIKIKDRFIEFRIDSLRGFSMYTTSKDLVVKRNELNYIDAVIIEDSYKIKVGEPIIVDGYTYKVNSIQQVGNLFYCIEESITKSAQYILPMLGETFMYYSFNTDLYNVYLSDCYTQLYLVYKFRPNAEYLDLEARLLKHPRFIKMIDPTPELVVTQFEIPEKYWQDVSLIMEGKYSKIDNYTKTLIYSFHGLTSSSILYSVLFNVEAYRKELESKLGCTIPPNIDLMTKPVKEKELWNYQTILKKSGIVV